MDNRVAIIGIIAENTDSAEQINDLLHQYSQYIVGRMGIPYREKKINIISVIIDAPQDDISSRQERSADSPDVSCQGYLFHKLEYLLFRI